MIIEMSNNKVSIPGSSKVTYTDFVVLIKKGEEVARLDAHFDLKDVPSEYHGTMLSLLQGRGVRLFMNDDPLTPIEKKELEELRNPKSLYDRFMGFFNGEIKQ
jgi:hypothetical protein